MNIFKSYKKSRYYLYVNITGLAIGLAASIMLVLFVVNELSYDKHFANNHRIVRLLTVSNEENDLSYWARTLRSAYTELPEKVPGIEASVQIYDGYQGEEIISKQNRFQNVNCLLTDPEIFKVFQMKFIKGDAKTSLASPKSTVLTRKYAEMMFGSPEEAMNQVIKCQGYDCVVSGVVEDIPQNSHFSFDVLISMQTNPGVNSYEGCEFFTYYLIKQEAPLHITRTGIESEYQNLLKPWAAGTGKKIANGYTELLSDIYFSPKAGAGFGESGSLVFIRILGGIAFLILLLAITNFINLFVTQSETRMLEIGIRKTNGAQITDIIRQFFSEVSVVVLIAFAIGFFLALLFIPYFSDLIGKTLDIRQLMNPVFILSILLLLGITIVFSALYPAIYLSRFSPLEILSKQIRFSKRRLTSAIVVFQSVISICLLSATFVFIKQTSFLQKIPLGYNPENVMSVAGNVTINKNYQAIKQQMLSYPEVKAVSGSQHIIGKGCSGEAISPFGENENIKSINSYRFLEGMPELMELELVEGRFWNENESDSIQLLILNEAAVTMLGGESPIEKFYQSNRLARVIGVVKDFYYDKPELRIEPIALSRARTPSYINIRFHENVSTAKARQITLDVLHQIDPDFVLDPIWNVDVYKKKFSEINRYFQVIMIGSSFSIVIAIFGLLAIHLFTSFRRTKEIGIRKVFGAEKATIFLLLTFNILKWIGIASLIAIPIESFLISKLLSNYENHVRPDWMVYVCPVLIQCAIAILTTSAITIKVLSQNLVMSLKPD